MLPYPIAPQLAQLRSRLPSGPRWLYEPKYDGFRCLLFKSGSRIRLQSRNLNDLTARFPEIVASARRLPDCVLDGELVSMVDGHQSFEALLARLDLRERADVGLVVFDALAWEGRDLRGLPFTTRRLAIENDPRLTGSLQLTVQTRDLTIAELWLEAGFSLGLEGVVAKNAALPYLSNLRCLVKVKHLETVDAVVGGYTGTAAEPRSLVLGLYDEQGLLRHVGGSSLPAFARWMFRPLATSGSPFTGRQPGNSRWQSHRIDDYTAVEPQLVCEVAFSRLDGRQFRHSVRFVRWRPDLSPKECTFNPVGSRPAKFSRD